MDKIDFSKVIHTVCNTCHVTMVMKVEGGALHYFCPQCNSKR